jgi:hypothetical protein
MTTSPEAEARTALSSRVAELTAAEAAQRQHAAAMAAAVQQRAAAVPSRLQQWIAQHQAEVSDPRTNARLQAAHFGAIADGVAPESDEYFRRIEAAIAHRPAVEPNKEPAMSYPPVHRPGPLVSAPVSRSGRAGIGAAPAGSRVNLSPEERQWARNSGISDSDYAKNKLRLLAEKRAGNYPDR